MLSGGETQTHEEAPLPLETRTYRFRADGTRPVLQIELTSGAAGKEAKEKPEKLTLELHSPISGEIFEARTSVGRLEVDKDGRVMYFCQTGEKVGFTFFVGRSLVVTMHRSTGEVVIESPSKVLSVTRGSGKPDELGNAPPRETIRIQLE